VVLRVEALTAWQRAGLPHVIERVLNHVSGAQGGLVSVYQRHEYANEREQAVLVWNAKMSELSELKDNDSSGH
jgi:hypothetical protein